jgi:hypothetical protein
MVNLKKWKSHGVIFPLTGGGTSARENYYGLWGLQKEKLHYHKKQTDYAGPD